MSTYSRNKEPLISRLTESKFGSGISKDEMSQMYQTHDGWTKVSRNAQVE